MLIPEGGEVGHIGKCSYYCFDSSFLEIYYKKM
jgi:hypothetical protein